MLEFVITGEYSWNPRRFGADLSNFNSYFTELSCPADCSSAGNCDISTGECSCDPGRFGADCSITTTTTVTTTTTTTTTTKRTFLQIAAHNEVISPGKFFRKIN